MDMKKDKKKWLGIGMGLGGMLLASYGVFTKLDWIWGLAFILVSIATAIPAIVVLELAKRNKLFPERDKQQ